LFVFLFYAKQKQTHSSDMLILFSCTIALAAESYTIHHLVKRIATSVKQPFNEEQNEKT